eukprot:scaffold10507_cov24-Prasinocladus_malaysianus.AAC.2
MLQDQKGQGRSKQITFSPHRLYHQAAHVFVPVVLIYDRSCHRRATKLSIQSCRWALDGHWWALVLDFSNAE